MSLKKELTVEELEDIEKRIADFTKYFFENECPEKCDQKKGCCGECDIKNAFLYASYGFHVGGVVDLSYSSPTPLEYFRELKEEYDFDPIDGFWAEKGCKLPRKYRSVSCLMFACDGVSKDFEDFGLVFRNLARLLINVRKRKFEKMSDENDS